jgi:hypothetical protein
MRIQNPLFWAKNRGLGLEMCTNVQLSTEMLQKRQKGGGKGGQNIGKSGRERYKKSARGRKKGRDSVFKINPTVIVGGDWGTTKHPTLNIELPTRELLSLLDSGWEEGRNRPHANLKNI